MADYQSYNLTA